MSGDPGVHDVRSRIQSLHSVALDLQRCETIDDVCSRTVEAAEDILEFDLCIVALEEGGELPLRARSEELPSDGTARTMSLDEGVAGLTFRTQQSYLFGDVSSVPEAKPQGPYRSCLSVPIGEYGIFQAVSEKSDFFDDEDLHLAELLVSHTRNALDRVERTNQLERFAQIVSHDLQNPLMVAQGRLELAREECDSEQLDRLGDALDRMDALIGDLLSLTHHRDSLDSIEPVTLSDLARSCWQHVATGDAELAIATDRTIRADRTRLQQLLENLFRNAVEHGGDNVTVRIGALDDTRGFFVEDDGLGIPEDDRNRVFETGYSTSEDGTGLGLAIVREVAAAHGCNVRVTDGDGGGARFEVTGVEFVDE